MSDWSVCAVGYAGNAMCNALKILPHIEAQGFDGKHFMHAAMNELHGMGVMRNAVMTAVDHLVQDIGSAITHSVSHQNHGQYSR